MTATKLKSVQAFTGYQMFPVMNANNIYYGVGIGSSGWTGTINGAPSGAVVTYTNVSGNKNTLVPYTTTLLAKQRLYNTTRGTNYLIANSNGTSTITMASTPTGWQSGDTITTLSPTLATAGFVDFEMTTGECYNQPFMAATLFYQDTGAPAGYYFGIQPFEAQNYAKMFSAFGYAANAYSTAFCFMKLTNNVFSGFWSATGAATCTIIIRQQGYIL